MTSGGTDFSRSTVERNPSPSSSPSTWESSLNRPDGPPPNGLNAGSEVTRPTTGFVVVVIL